MRVLHLLRQVTNTEKHMATVAQEILDICKTDADVKLVVAYHAARVSFHSDKTEYTLSDGSTIIQGAPTT